MKLTDFCLVFAALFVCLFLGRDLYIEGLLVQQTTQIAYDRQMDRIAEDANLSVTFITSSNTFPPQSPEMARVKA